MAIESTTTADSFTLTTDPPNSGNGGATSGAVTFMYWFKSSGNPGGDTPLIENIDLGNDTAWTTFSDAGELILFYSSGGGVIAGTTSIFDGAWRSIAVTIAAGGSTKIYINGNGTPDGSGSQSVVSAPTLTFGINAEATAMAGLAFYGLKVWNRELSAGEVTTENGSYAPVSTSSLYGSWLLTSTAATISDDSGNGHTLTRAGTWNTVSDPPPFGGGGGLMWL